MSLLRNNIHPCAFQIRISLLGIGFHFEFEVMRSRDVKVAPPKVDGSKWESTLALAQHHREHKQHWEAVALQIPQHPPVPTGGEANLILSTIPALELIWAALLQLQKDSTLAAIYKPLVASLVLCLQALPEAGVADGFAQVFVEELQNCEQRHLAAAVPATPEPGSGRVHAGWTSLNELLDCMALCLPAFRQGLWLQADERRARQRRVGAAFLSYFMYQHGLTDHTAPLPPSLLSGAASQSQPRVDRRARVPGVADLTEMMAQVSGTTDRTEPASTMSTQPLSVASFLTHQVSSSYYFRVPFSRLRGAPMREHGCVVSPSALDPT